jgi:hypothetical protein
MRVGLVNNGSFGLAGTVSGVGGLNMFWNSSTVPEVPTNAVTLANANSTFEGGVSVRNLIVNVKENGAVPAEGGVFALTNSIVNFDPYVKGVDSLKSFMLPNGIIHVDGSRSVTGGWGKWKTLVKTGVGTADYDSAIGAEELELREGIFKLTMSNSLFSGLIEGARYFESSTDASAATRNVNISYTNALVRSPYYANAKNNTYWTAVRPEWDVETKKGGAATVYTGYIWNRGSTDATWTFACHVAKLTVIHLDLDGDGVLKEEERIIYNYTPDRVVAMATVTVSPGPHAFRFASYSTGDGGVSGNVDSWKGLGLRWDRQGRNELDPANFEILEDPGDGSLLTWAKPGVDVSFPGTDESLKFGRFDLVKFTGGTLHLNGVTNTVSEVEGLPKMAGTGKLIIKDTWTIDAADLADKAKVDGLSLAFGEDVELVINKNRAVKSSNGTYEWTVFESEDDISGSISVKDPEMAKRWRVNISGKTVKLKYYPAGTVIIVR